MVFVRLEFDFTVARGLGDLHKEMCSMNIPLVLLGPQPAVRNVLNEATNTLIPHVPNERDLETLLQGMAGLNMKLWSVYEHLISFLSFRFNIRKPKNGISRC